MSGNLLTGQKSFDFFFQSQGKVDQVREFNFDIATGFDNQC